MITVVAFLTYMSAWIDTSQINRQEIHCLAKAVYHESRGEPIEGQIAVAMTVLNRARDPRWPSALCEVVYQPWQFSDIEKTKILDNKAWKVAVEVASFAYVGFFKDPTNGAHHYYAPRKLERSPEWASKLTYLTQIGEHKFYD